MRRSLTTAAIVAGAGALAWPLLQGEDTRAVGIAVLLPGLPMTLWARRVWRIWQTGVYEQLAWVHHLALSLLLRLPGLGLLLRWQVRHGSPRTRELLEDLDTPAVYHHQEDRYGYWNAFVPELKLFGFAVLFTFVPLLGAALDAWTSR